MSPLVKRALFLGLSLVVLYLLLPGLIAVFGSSDDLRSISPWWLAAWVAYRLRQHDPPIVLTGDDVLVAANH